MWAPGYQTYGTKCEDIETDLLADRSLGAHEMFPYQQGTNPWITYESMELVRFVHRHGLTVPGSGRPLQLGTDPADTSRGSGSAPRGPAGAARSQV